MVLPRCSLLPHGLLPLCIFEPRYREMLRHALQNERLFCIGMRRMDEENDSDEAIYPFSTAALVRACVHHGDGTSHLVLQGVQRIRFTGWSQHTPFRIARIEAVPTVISEPGDLPELRAAVMERARHLVSGPDACALAGKMCAIEDTEIFADFVGSNFLPSACLKQRTLGMGDLNERLRFLAEVLAPV